MTLNVQTDRKLIRAGASSTRYILARVTAPRAQAGAPRTPVNVALVLDRSGSMQSERKFGLAREAVEKSLGMLRPDDRFSLVVYDEVVDVLMPSTRATPEARRIAVGRLAEIHPRGSTDLCAGWSSGCEQIAQFQDRNHVNRCLLLTDGLANHGITDRDALARHAGELRLRGVSTSTFGVGADFDEVLLRDMAHEGGGNFYFIEGASQIPEMLAGELGEALEITMRNASVIVTPPAGARAECMNRFRRAHLGDRNELRVELGDLTSAQELDVVLSVTFPRGDVGSETSASVSVASGNEVVAGAECRVVWTYAGHEENDRQPRNRDVDRAVAEVYAARARAEATDANRRGDYGRARQVLERTAGRIRGYAGDDTRLLDVAKSVAEAVVEYDAPMSAAALKMSTFVAESSGKGRMSSGRARKST